MIFLYMVLSIFEDTEVGVRPEAMGYAYTALSSDASGVFFNPSGMCFAVKNEASFYYKHLWQGIEGLHTASFSSVVYSGYGVFGVGAVETGFELEREFMGVFCFARKLYKYLYAGASFKLYYLSVRRFGNAESFGVDFGLMARGYQNFRVGLLFKNFVKPSFGKIYHYSLPFALKAGIAYSGFSGLVSCVEVSKKEGEDVVFSFGEEFEIIQQKLHFLAGFNSNPLKMSAGIRLFLKCFSLNYGVDFNPEVGANHFISISLYWGEEREFSSFEVE